MDQQSPKQRVAELLRNAESIVITVSSNPDTDSVAGAIALGLMMEKLGKKSSVIISNVPANLDFLPTEGVRKEPAVSRDFIIEVDTSKVEADKLKYTQEGKNLKIYLTPYEGNFSREDVNFEYGDYHNEVVVLLGGSGRSELDSAIAKHKQLLTNAKLVTIHHQEKPAEDRAIAWHENTSSVCEMLMSISEALESGILDEQIATPLLTGIIAKTNHFTGPNTSPKVMTMAAQLMAAGANQSKIIENLNRSHRATVSTEAPRTQVQEEEQAIPKAEESKNEPPNQAPQAPPSVPGNTQPKPQEHQPDQTEDLKNQKGWKPFNIPEPTKDSVAAPPSTPQLQPAPVTPPTSAPQSNEPGTSFALPAGSSATPKYLEQQNQPLEQAKAEQQPPPQSAPQSGNNVEAARRAVEEAMSQGPPPETNLQQRFENPPAPSIDSGQNQQVPPMPGQTQVPNPNPNPNLGQPPQQ